MFISPRFRHSLCLLSAVMMLSACPMRQAQIEDQPTETAQAAAVASDFLQAFVGGKLEQVLQMSDLPFWGDGVLVADRDHLKEELMAQFGESLNFKFQIKGTQFLTLEQAHVVAPHFYHRLQDSHFTEQYSDPLYLILFLVEVEGHEDNGIVLLHRQADGMWKVVGLSDA